MGFGARGGRGAAAGGGVAERVRAGVGGEGVPGRGARCVDRGVTALIGSVARGYRGASGAGRAELMQEGVVGLLRALERYDPDLGTPFWAYASWWVRQAMQ